MYTGHIHIIQRMSEDNRRVFRKVRDRFKENIPEGKIYKNLEERKEDRKEDRKSEEEVYEACKRIAFDMRKEQKRRDRYHFVFIVASIFLIALAIHLLFF